MNTICLLCINSVKQSSQHSFVYKFILNEISKPQNHFYIYLFHTNTGIYNIAEQKLNSFDIVPGLKNSGCMIALFNFSLTYTCILKTQSKYSKLFIISIYPQDA